MKFHGNVPGAARMLAAFDMLALSSRTEGTPMVLLEAMAAGVPIVATAVGGVPDILSAGEASLVAPNDPRALAAALDATLADTSLAQSRASAARERVAREFDHATWLDRYEQIYPSNPEMSGGDVLLGTLVVLPAVIGGYAYVGYPAILRTVAKRRPVNRLMSTRGDEWPPDDYRSVLQRSAQHRRHAGCAASRGLS